MCLMTAYVLSLQIIPVWDNEGDNVRWLMPDTLQK